MHIMAFYYLHKQQVQSNIKVIDVQLCDDILSLSNPRKHIFQHIPNILAAINQQLA
jgi:hypothetical protein